MPFIKGLLLAVGVLITLAIPLRVYKYFTRRGGCYSRRVSIVVAALYGILTAVYWVYVASELRYDIHAFLFTTLCNTFLAASVAYSCLSKGKSKVDDGNSEKIS